MGTLLRAAALAALSLVLLAGCGDTADRNDYVKAVNKAQTEFAGSVSDIKVSSDAEENKQVFSRLDASLDKIVADLKAVTPPDDVKDLHGELITQFERFDTAVNDAGDAVDSGDQKKIATAMTKFGTEASDVSSKASSTIDAINRQLQK